jgi:hypothetical protein
MLNQTIDEILIRLGNTVLTLAHPDITRTDAEKAALAKSVNQFSVCAESSKDPRVISLAVQLEAWANFHMPNRLH